jgi:hypothetical protein
MGIFVTPGCKFRGNIAETESDVNVYHGTLTLKVRIPFGHATMKVWQKSARDFFYTK